jgi:LAO/AO transport system kinase
VSRADELVAQLLAGHRAAAARLISWVENNYPEASRAMQLLIPHTGRARVVGITGPPGAGKSTLTAELIRHYRQKGLKVGVVAVDPSSTITGGAVLGDRVRMQEFATDAEVFIRSMATRGNLGGLARMTNDVVRILDAFGKDVVIVETVGVGQDEVDIARSAQTTVLVQVPGLGDDVQAIKAGVLEVADIIVINKADREGADRLQQQLRMALEMKPRGGWQVPILKTVAIKGEGIEDLAHAIDDHYAYLKETGELLERERRKLHEELVRGTADWVARRVRWALENDPRVEELVQQLLMRRSTPDAAIGELVKLAVESSAVPGG